MDNRTLERAKKVQIEIDNINNLLYCLGKDDADCSVSIYAYVEKRGYLTTQLNYKEFNMVIRNAYKRKLEGEKKTLQSELALL